MKEDEKPDEVVEFFAPFFHSDPITDEEIQDILNSLRGGPVRCPNEE